MMMEDDMIIYKEKNVQLREMMCEMKWGELKCLQKPTNQMEIDGGTCLRIMLCKLDEQKQDMLPLDVSPDG